MIHGQTTWQSIHTFRRLAFQSLTSSWKHSTYPICCIKQKTRVRIRREIWYLEISDARSTIIDYMDNLTQFSLWTNHFVICSLEIRRIMGRHGNNHSCILITMKILAIFFFMKRYSSVLFFINFQCDMKIKWYPRICLNDKEDSILNQRKSFEIDNTIYLVYLNRWSLLKKDALTNLLILSTLDVRINVYIFFHARHWTTSIKIICWENSRSLYFSWISHEKRTLHRRHVLVNYSKSKVPSTISPVTSVLIVVLSVYFVLEIWRVSSVVPLSSSWIKSQSKTTHIDRFIHLSDENHDSQLWCLWLVISL